jgi:hypothetical protein
VSAPPDLRPLELRLAPEYRRCAAYVAVAFTVLAATTVGLTWLALNNASWPKVLSGLAVFATAMVLLIAITVRYQLRIDQQGVWRRRFFRWDLWPWEAFEQGRIRHGKYGDQLTNPEKSWYWRTISASLLGEADRIAYEAVVGRYRVPPPPPELPDDVDFKYGLRARLELSREGVRLRAHQHEDGQLVPWKDVVRAEVVRFSHDRPDFSILELHLPASKRPVRLTHYKGQPKWTGADAVVIALYLRRHLGDHRFLVTALRGAPADVAEADRRLARLAEHERQRQRMSRLFRYVLEFWALLIFVLVVEPWNRPNPVNWGKADWEEVFLAAFGIAIMMGLYAAMVFGLVSFQGRDLRRQRDEVLHWRTALVAISTHPTEINHATSRVAKADE